MSDNNIPNDDIAIDTKTMSTSWKTFSPFLLYIVACVIITIFQIVWLYVAYKKSPTILGLVCNIMSCILCASIIYFALGTSNVAWGFSIFLVVCMLSCCSAAISGTSLSKYTMDPTSYVLSLFKKTTTSETTV